MVAARQTQRGVCRLAVKNTEVLLCEFYALGDVHYRVAQFFNGSETGQQSAAVCDLDRKTRAGIELQQQGTAIAIKDHVGPDIAQARHLIAGGCQSEQGVPVGYPEVMEIQPGVGVAQHGDVVLNCPQSPSCAQA